jgi:tRNA uracil 4-sulfurtransferase
MNAIVVHYKELALKGRNRPWFIQLLVRNMKAALADLNVRSIRSVMGRIQIDVDASVDRERITERLARIFGIANFSFAGRAPHDFDALAASILSEVGDRRPSSFRVSGGRADEPLPFPPPQP